VLPVVRTQYPKTPAVLLDGIPIVKDVVSQDVGSSTRFERVQSDALTGSGKWRTVLLQSFGEGHVNGGYFAVDVTKPDRAADHAPKFLWQLTRDASGLPLFGNGGTPLITTIFLQSGPVQLERSRWPCCLAVICRLASGPALRCRRRSA